ncbi:YybH family protein [Hydrogenophaga sp. RWCD_12]|uniref:YybH family protein n=1 Tax=Hydrogenophaga sp. RWCD_12 TaxID=3391190 RepID=UPI00398461A1
MFTLIAAFGATFGAMALMLSIAGRLSAETLAVALLILVLGFIVVLFSADSLRARPVGGASGFQLFTRHQARRWPLPVVLVCSLLAVAYVAFRPLTSTHVTNPQPSGVATDVVSPPTTPSSPVTSAPPATPANPAPPPAAPPADDSRQEVTAAVEAWRSAWAARDVQRYLAAYAADFRPAEGTSHEAWVSQRKDRLRNARGLRVLVEQLEIGIDGDRATVRFLQRYRAGSLDDRVRKRLVFVRGADGWKISEETVEAPGKP